MVWFLVLVSYFGLVLIVCLCVCVYGGWVVWACLLICFCAMLGDFGWLCLLFVVLCG